MRQCLTSDDYGKGAGSNQGSQYHATPIACPRCDQRKQQCDGAEKRRGAKQSHRNYYWHVIKGWGPASAAKTRRIGAGVFLFRARTPDHSRNDAADDRHESSE
jgi:catalase